MAVPGSLGVSTLGGLAGYGFGAGRAGFEGDLGSSGVSSSDLV